MGSQVAVTSQQALVTITATARTTAIPPELPRSSEWTSWMEKLILPQIILGHCLHEGKPYTGQLAASVLLLTLIAHTLIT